MRQVNQYVNIIKVQVTLLNILAHIERLFKKNKKKIKSMTELSWATIENDLKKLSSSKLSEDELFKLWQVFHKIGVNEEEGQIDIEEAAILIEDFMLAIGIPFVKGPLYGITTGYKITFLEFAECFQERYVFNTPQR